MKKGTLIILNGGSSAGKTSLGRALQDLYEEPYLLLGIDAFWMAIPPKQLDLEHVEPRYYTCKSHFENGLEYFEITPGPILDRVMRVRYEAIARYLDAGFNVIADDVMWKREWLLDALEIFRGYRVIFVGVYVSDAEGARREQVRGDRHPGWDRGSARFAHRDAIYDLTVDTTAEPPDAIARRIRNLLESETMPTAFDQLRAKFLHGQRATPQESQ